MKIPTKSIIPNPRQPRKRFAGIEDLAQSIERHGLLEPIMVRPLGKKYEIVQGERRYRACKSLGLEEIEVTVRQVTDEEAYELSLVENLQREDLDPIEEAEAFAQLQQANWTQEGIGTLIGKSQQYVADHLTLLRLTEPIQDLLTARAVNASVAIRLARVENPDTQNSLAQRAVKDTLTVGGIERAIAQDKRKAMIEAERQRFQYAKAHPDDVPVGKKWHEKAGADLECEFSITGEMNGLPFVHCECIDEEYQRLKEDESPIRLQQTLQELLGAIGTVAKRWGPCLREYKDVIGDAHWVDWNRGVCRMTPALVDGLTTLADSIRDFEKKYRNEISTLEPKAPPERSGGRPGWTTWGNEILGGTAHDQRQ